MDYDKFLGTLVEIKNQYNQGIHGDEMLPVDLARLVSIVGQRVNLPIEFKAANWGASKIGYPHFVIDQGSNGPILDQPHQC